MNEVTSYKLTAKTILLVDDEEYARDNLSRIIERRCKMNIFSASRGLEAVEMYRMLKPDCVLLDLGLPDINGIIVLERMKLIDPKAKVYIISGYDDPSLKQKAKELGALDYLTKPIVFNELITILKRI